MTSWWRRHRHRRVVLTHDGDFGTLALLGRRPVVGIVRIRPGHIRPRVTSEALDRLFALDLDEPTWVGQLRDEHARRSRPVRAEDPSTPD